MAQVEAELAQQLTDAKAALAHAVASLHTADQTHTRLGQTHQHTQAQLHTLQADTDQAAQRLDDWLQAWRGESGGESENEAGSEFKGQSEGEPNGEWFAEGHGQQGNHRGSHPGSERGSDWGTARPAISMAELEKKLAVSPAWLASERDALAAMAATEAKAQTVLDTHTASAQVHQQQRPAVPVWAAESDGLQGPDQHTSPGTQATQPAPEPTDSPAHIQHHTQQLNQRLTLLTAQWQATSDALAHLSQARLQDAQRQRDSAQLGMQLAAQTQTERVWAQLGELIGSADGKKFRNFAQQLTLDILLGYANRHLQDLSRRYRLERIADSLALLVVDQDMGDEVRSVHSLSGGESFLVSLALALGLASLSSHRVKVESLFIDEGFGSLDADALQVAMDALDNLQALGRKVGVISHVQEMTERIATRVQVHRVAGGLSRVVVS